MSMELRHLAVFVAVAEECSFSRAAARLMIAQSAVSRTVRDLERDLGGPLFVRSSRHVALTDMGRVTLDHARLTLDAAAATRTAACAALDNAAPEDAVKGLRA